MRGGVNGRTGGGGAGDVGGGGRVGRGVSGLAALGEGAASGERGDIPLL